LHDALPVKLEVVERAEIGIVVGVGDLNIADKIALDPLTFDLLAVWQHQ
jgi:hypothetical protein